MDKRMITILSAIILALIGIIVAGVWVLYSPSEKNSSASAFKIDNTPEDSVDVNAVPTLDHPLVREDEQLSEQPQPEVQAPVQPSSFKVRNCGTGKDNTLRQNEDNSIELIDHTGKSLWKKQLSDRICSDVVQVDCFSNGKIQFLIVSGSVVHLFDRLGREVSGYPLELSHKAVCGPEETTKNGKKYYKVDCEEGPVYFSLKDKKIQTQLP